MAGGTPHTRHPIGRPEWPRHGVFSAWVASPYMETGKRLYGPLINPTELRAGIPTGLLWPVACVLRASWLGFDRVYVVSAPRTLFSILRPVLVVLIVFIFFIIKQGY